MRLPAALAACITVRGEEPSGAMEIDPLSTFTPMDMADAPAAESHVSQQLGLVNRGYVLDGLYLRDDLAGDE